MGKEKQQFDWKAFRAMFAATFGKAGRFRFDKESLEVLLGGIYMFVYDALWYIIGKVISARPLFKVPLFLLYLPLIWLLVVFALAVFVVSGAGLLTLGPVYLSISLAIRFLRSHRVFVLLSRLLYSLVVLAFILFIFLLLGKLGVLYLVWARRTGSLVYGIFSLGLIFVMFLYELLLILALKVLRKEFGGFKQNMMSLRKSAEENSQPEKLAGMPGHLSFLFRNLTSPSGFMSVCFCASAVSLCFLWLSVFIFQLRFPHSLFAFQGVTSFTTADKALVFVIKQVFEVIPFSIVELLFTFGKYVSVIKPWGYLLQLFVQAVVLSDLIIVLAGIYFYLSYWKYKKPSH